MKIKDFFFICLLLSCFTWDACTVDQTEHHEQPLPNVVEDSVDFILKVRQTSRLYTAEYQVHKIVTHADVKRLKTTVLGYDVIDTDLPLGDRKIAIPIDVTLKAYIDFSHFSEKQVERSSDGRHIHIVLPDPKVVVTSSKVDHASVRQFSALLRSDYSDAEMTNFTAQGVRAVLYAVPQMGILETARQSAAATLIPLVASMGYEPDHIVVTFRKDFTGKDLPLLFDNEKSVVRFGK
ncbi:MAG: DUF4230 domain-containing protein [Bacteroidales bacterium]|nr:DUF4230 domain-containing protein [Bacteroidales bacterium]